MKKRIVVLGCRGFIGKSLLAHLKNTHSEYEIIGLSSLDLNLENDHQHEVFQSEHDTYLIICSGLKRNHGETIEVLGRNLKIAENLFLLTSNVSFKKVIYLSSCAVYGEDVAHSIISESIPLTPTSFYGIGKAQTEYLLQKSAGDKLVILRPPTVYGENSNDQNYDPYGFLKKIFKSETINLWGDGSEKREFIYLSDLIKIISESLHSSFTGIVNTISGNSYTFTDIICESEKLTGNKAILEHRERSKDKVDHFFDPSLIKSHFPQVNFTSLADGLNEILKREF